MILMPIYKFTNSFLDASVTTVREKRQCQIWRMIIITSVVRKLLKIMIGLHDSSVFQRLINSDCVANENGARWQLCRLPSLARFLFVYFVFFSSVFCQEETAEFRPSLLNAGDKQPDISTQLSVIPRGLWKMNVQQGLTFRNTRMNFRIVTVRAMLLSVPKYVSSSARLIR